MNGLQYKENIEIISGGYPGEDVGSNGLVQNWTDVPSSSGSSDVTYYFHDSASFDNNNSSRVDVRVVESWNAALLAGNVIRITVTVSIPSIARTRIGSPSAYDTFLFVRQSAGGANIWTSGTCDNTTTSHTIATNIDLGTFTIDLPPETTGSERGTVYFRSNACGHNNDSPPSIYIDEFWMGIAFRNTLPKDYVPGMIYDGSSDWLSHNRSGGALKLHNGSAWGPNMRTENGGTGTGNPPLLRWPNEWRNMRRTGVE